MAELRKWQKEALQIFIDNKVLMAEVATGCGKTFFAVTAMRKILEENPDSKILIVVPKIVIMNGWLKELYSFFSIDELACFGDGMKDYSRITITTTVSLNKMAVDIFDFLIIDEAHNFYSKRLLKVLSLEHWKYKMALSATIHNDSYSHMKLEKIFQYRKYKYGIEDGLRDGVLNKFEWYDYEITLDGETADKNKELTLEITQLLASVGGYDGYLRLSADNVVRARLNKLFEMRKKLIFNYAEKFNALVEICEDNKNRKIIIFNQYNNIGDKIVDHLTSIGLDVRIVNSDLSDGEKKRRIRDFQDDKYNILITSRMFDEGYNLPSLDTAIIFSGDSSVRQSTQRIGRVLRLKKYNSKLYQIYCKDTFEHKYAERRISLFKPLAEVYNKSKW